ncbi:MAG: carboxymuconolactone decarboxylase family protein [Acidobacteria bacterium]|nr:carboxymuconolactone decarboxylase family protein [Acidobacteriota bacterium]
MKQKFGRVPNITRLMANSPAALEGYLSFIGALAGGSLDPQLRERIAIAVASANGCDYCLSAHTAAAKMLGVSQEDMLAAQQAESSGENDAVALKFATKVVRERGWVNDEDLNALRQAGFGDGEVVEIIAVTVLNIFTNYFNHIAQTEIDFPLVRTANAASG